VKISKYIFDKNHASRYIFRMYNIEKYLGKDSPIASNIHNYEYRESQIEMAQAVSNAIKNSQHLLVEAGCGIGKSFAYLIPFILWTEEKKTRRVVISTYTKTLQQQLLDKDIPFLAKALGMNLKAALCVGTQNYVCLKKLNSIWQDKLLNTLDETRQIQDIFKWVESSEDGLKMNINFKVSESLWGDICRTTETCHNNNCPFLDECFYFKAKKKQVEANILIANHNMLFTDIASGSKVLPKYESIVFDEAQNIEDIASDTLSMSVSMLGVKIFLSKIYKARSKRCLLSKTKTITRDSKKDLIETVKLTQKAANLFFTSVLDEFNIQDTTFTINTPDMFHNNLSAPMLALADILEKTSKELLNEEERAEFNHYSRRCKNTALTLETILSRKMENYVYYLEISTKKKGIRCSFSASPIDVSELLKQLVFEDIVPVILTSATLTVNNSFNFIKKRLGIAGADEIRLDSPFNFHSNVLLYAPADLPDPSYALDSFKYELSDRISEILEIVKGRTFILFTSYSMLYSTGEELLNRFPGLNFLFQGELSRNKMLDSFKENSNSVLLGTTTFWQGVDIPGRDLECVIITKLPFAVPDNPITESRINRISSEGRNPFMEYQVPIASLLFKQGFGRLIRHKQDFGIVAVLDPRVKKRKYGKTFINSLPECNEIKNISELSLEYKKLSENL
jgi:ATP-dependent DNA helicase DinG